MISLIRSIGQQKIAVVLLAFFAIELFSPSVALALTSGPTTPETTSFEPVDTTDMVNMQSGDFTYSAPLLEVPGPEGGYPLSLSYHAGILPGEDASWVGLGWALNPGAITRTVNGYPDDWVNPQQIVRDYWVGGKQETYSVGISVGIAGAASVGVGLDFSTDTYRGFGLGTSVSASAGIANTPLSIGFTVGTSAYGQGYGGVNLGIGVGPGKGKSGLSAGINAGLNFSEAGSSAGFSGGVGYRKGAANQTNNMDFSLIGSTLVTGGTKPSLSVGGFSSSAYNQNSGKISTKSSGFSIPIPIWYGINLQLGYSKVRYWSDETVTKYTHGSLNMFSERLDGDERTYDTYSLLDDYQGQNFVDEPDPRRTLGGSYLDVDQYAVNAQGLAGNIKPYFFIGNLRSENIKENSSSTVKSSVTYTSANQGTRPEFRFVNDFSNAYLQDYSNDGFDRIPTTGHTSAPKQFDGYTVKNKLQGSKNIETYTLDNVPVKPRNAKGYTTSWIKSLVVEGKAASAGRSSLIGGFSITNESGVTYHFSLPAYSYREQSYQEIVDKSGGVSFNRQTKPEPYAYTWHLTAITGADYIDKNNNKVVDEGDWGYWVSFEYGKYTSNYIWRNPEQGFNRDEDGTFQNMSIGTKEVYYLNAIRTRSHMALFEKEARFDAKGVASSSYSISSVNQTSNSGFFDINSVQSMKLNRIFLINAADSSYGNTNKGTQTSLRTAACSTCELPANVFDSDDVQALGRATIESKSIKIIDFNHDYSLANGTYNSFDINNPTKKLGKLTLTSYDVRGKKGAKILPPTKFDYDLTDTRVTSAIVNRGGITFTTTNPVFHRGDMLKTSDGIFYGIVTSEPTLTSTSPNTYTYTKEGNRSFSVGTSLTVLTTKNPDYSRLNKDYWGYYKADYITPGEDDNDYNLGVETTELSSFAVDAWSLRKVTTALGNQINIDYESDDFSDVVMEENAYPVMTDITKLDDYRIRFKLKSNVPNIHQYVTVGKTYTSLIVADDIYHYPSSSRVFDNSYDQVNKILFDNVLTITSRNDTYIEARSNVLLKAYDVDDGSTPQHRDFQLQAGNMQITSSGLKRYGGGIRVKSIAVEDKKGYHLKTEYAYGLEGNANVSSGSTSYLPGILPQFQLEGLTKDVNITSRADVRNAISKYKKLLYKDHVSIYALAREIPSPFVLYKNVTAYTSVLDNTGNIIHNTGRTVYEFDTFRKNMAGRIVLENRSVPAETTTYRNQVVKKFLAGIGNLKSTKTYNGNGKLISQVANHYLHDGLETKSLADFMTEYESRLEDFNFQGLLKERVFESKQVYTKESSYLKYTTYRVYNGKEELPCIMTGTTTVDYITGLTSSTTNLAFDFYSGSLTKQVEVDGYGNRFMTETTPAYNVYPDMGIYAGSKKNMLSQIAETKVYKVDNNNVLQKLVSASVQTWSKSIPSLDANGASIQQAIWRMADSYIWAPAQSTTDGLTTLDQYQAFNYSSLASLGAGWQKITGISLYNVYSKAIADIDMNGNSAATHFGTKDSKVSITGGPANYWEIAFSGAEDENITNTNVLEVKRGDATVSTAQAHTGGKSLLLAKSQTGYVYSVAVDKIKSNRNYSAAVWVRAQTGTATDAKLHYQINGVTKGSSTSSAATTKKSGDWILLTLPIKKEDLLAGSTLKVFVKNDHATSIFADDFRFQPSEAVTTAYVYDAFSGELTHVLNNNNLFTKYEYDDAGRLVGTYVEKLSIAPFKVSENQYNYAMPFSAGNQTVYARIEYDNVNKVSSANGAGGTNYTINATVNIRFYWDIACTQRATLTSALDLAYRQHSDWFINGIGGQSTNDYNVRANSGTNTTTIHSTYVLDRSETYLEERYEQYYITDKISSEFELLSKSNSGNVQYFPLATKTN